jgi:glutathione peroxidase
MYKSIYFLFPFLLFTGIYDFSLPSAQGVEPIHLSDYQGKKILIVNTASSSEQANQYTQLEELYEKYSDSLVVIAVPSNSFGNEQGSDSAIYNHLVDTYGVTFPVAGQTEVAGDSTCQLYQWLTQKALNGAIDTKVKTDFQKFLVDSDGQLIGVFAASVDPMSSDIQDAITGNEQ